MISTSGYKLGVKCCFCGGSLTIDEASRTISCPHCASILKIARSGDVAAWKVERELSKREVKFLIDHHLKRNKLPLVSTWLEMTSLYLPFWRMTGLVFLIKQRSQSAPAFGMHQPDEEHIEEEPQSEVKITRKEMTFCANNSRDWSLESLGVRTEILTLKPLDSAFRHSNHLVPVTIDHEQAEQRFEATFLSTAALSLKGQSDIETRTTSLEGMVVYFPVWLVQFVNADGLQVAEFDPVARRVISIKQGKFDTPARESGFADERPALEIIPHRCPNCGSDLPVNERSVTYHCGNCRRLLLEDGSGYREIKVQIPGGTDPAHRLFPFWVFDLKGMSCSAEGDLFAALRLLRFRNDRFFVPAFDVTNPAKLLRLISHYNGRSDHFQFIKNPTDNYSFVDLTTSPDEASDLIVPLLAAARACKGYSADNAPLPREISLSTVDLVWLPFVLDHYFWRETLTGAAIEKAAVGSL